MSEVENAVTGATAAPVSEESQQAETQVEQQETATAESDAQREEQPRDEKGKFVQKRINELTRARYEAQRLAEARGRENAELRAQLQRVSNPPPDPDIDPKAYVAHLAREEARALIESERSQWAQQQEQQRAAQQSAEFAQRAQSYAAQAPDFEEAVGIVDQFIAGNPALTEVLVTSEFGPQVIHHLGTHVDELAQIAQLPPHLAAAQVARLEAKLAAPKPKPVTKAPAPVPTVGGGSALPGVRDGMDYEAYKAARLR